MSLRHILAANRPPIVRRATVRAPITRMQSLLPLAQRLEYSDEVMTTDSIAAALTNEAALFQEHNAPFLNQTLTTLHNSYMPTLNHEEITAGVLDCLRRSIALQAKRNVPILGDSFPWLLEGDTLSARPPTDERKPSSSSTSLVARTLDPLKFTTHTPAKWMALLEEVPLSARNLKSDWLDVFHAVANNGSWYSAEEFELAATNLASLIDAYRQASLPGAASEAGGSDLPFSINHKEVLESALSPQWLRKMRGHFISMHRMDEFGSLLQACIHVEEAIANTITGHPMPSLVADDEHLSFYCALFGRREAQGQKAARWEATLRALRWAIPRLGKDSPTQGSVRRLTDAFKVVANVCVFIHNDGNEDKRAGQLITVCCDAACVNKAAALKLIETIEASLFKKIVVTTGQATPSVLRAVSMLLTIKHCLATMPADAGLSEMRHIEALLHHKEQNAVPDKKAVDVLDMPAAIMRSPTRHVDYLCSAAKGVVASLLELLRSSKNNKAAAASSQSLIDWLRKEVSTCTAIPDWRHPAALIDVLAPLQRQIKFDFYEGVLPAQLSAAVWACGCGASNSLLATRCWSCVSSKNDPPCAKCGAPLAATADTPCGSCGTAHPRTVALAAADSWQCVSCNSFTPVGDTVCSKCEAINPAFVTHSCSRCGTTTSGELRESFCLVCGEANAGADTRLVMCGGCGQLHPITYPSCPHCYHKEPVMGKRAQVSHFSWTCGCGSQNSPLTRTCRTCGGGSGSGYTCGSCHTKHPTIRKRLLPSLPKIVPVECKSCDALHPRDATLLSRRLSVCASCHSTVPLDQVSCGQCGAATNNASTRFMPNFADLPWHCHGCGTRNLIIKDDAESALRCEACDVDRVSPLLFSESSPWDCATCGTVRNYGFSCRTCDSLHASIPEAEVTMWKCGSCSANSPSWMRQCKSCSQARTGAEVSFKYAPWQCPSCRTYNGSARVGICIQCGVGRPPLPVCGLCHGRHLKVECSRSTAGARSEGLESILLGSAALDGDMDSLLVPPLSVFDDPLHTPFLL